MSGHRRSFTIARRTLLALALAAPLASGGAHAIDRLTLTAGAPNGGYFKAAAGLAEYIKAEIPGIATTVIPGSGWANVERLAPELKLADIAVIENALASMAYAGNGPTGRKYDFRMIAAIRGPGAAQAVITEEAGIGTFEELRERRHPIRIAMAGRRQLATAQAEAILEAYGMPFETIESWGGKLIFTSQKEGIRMIMDGLADMWFTGGSLWPHHQYIKLGARKPFRLLPLGKEVAQQVADRFGQRIFEMPAGVYEHGNGTNDAYWTPNTTVALGVRTALPEDLVYRITAALAKHKDAFHQIHRAHEFYDPETAWRDVGGAPLHPGARRFYREMGYLK